MPICLTTIYTKDRLLRQTYYIIAGKKFFWSVMIIATFLISGMRVLLTAFGLSNSTVTLYLILIIVIDLVYIVCFLILPQFTIKSSKHLNTTVHYSFDADCFQIEAVSAYASGTTTVQYPMLTKIQKNKNDLYLFISHQQSYIADLTELSPEQTAALKQTLQTKINPKKIKWPD